MPVLQILNGEREGLEVSFDGAGDFFIGKEEGCVARIGDPGVSRKHAKITQKPDGSWQLEDLGSANGTYVNFKKRSQGELSDLVDKDIIFIGRTVVKFWSQKPSSGGGGGPVSREQLRDLLHATVPIKGLSCPGCRKDLEADMVAKVREQEQVEVARRLGLHEKDQASVDRLIAQARR
jgi:pSer/pThr/pTyr-binding forkhead associated (FHA) protein